MENSNAFPLVGSVCSCSLSTDSISINGNYYLYSDNKRLKTSGSVTVELLNVMRIGITKTYSRLMFLFPMCFGFAALIIKNIPPLELKVDVIPDVYSPGVELWSLPNQDIIWKTLAVLCLLSIPLYWLSYRNDLEVNTTVGRFLLPRKGMDKVKIAYFQTEFTRLKENRLRARNGYMR